MSVDRALYHTRVWLLISFGALGLLSGSVFDAFVCLGFALLCNREVI